MSDSPWIVSIAVPAAAGLIGVLIGAWLSGARERSQRRLAFREQQLRDFYSPMVGLRDETRMLSELRLRIQQEADMAWRELAAEAVGIGIEASERLSAERFPEFSKLIDYDNTQLEQELLPSYRKMVSLFRDCYWLADPDTRRYYQELVSFVEIWNRWLAGALPWEVAGRLGHSEKRMQAFYAHIQERLDSLREKVERGKP